MLAGGGVDWVRVRLGGALLTGWDCGLLVTKLASRYLSLCLHLLRSSLLELR